MNGYTEINILGKKRGLKFGALAFEKIGSALDFIQKAGTEYYSIKLLADVLNAGLVNNCFRKDELPDFTFSDVYDWVEDNASNQAAVDDMAKVMKCFETCKFVQDAVEQAKEITDAAKKKSGAGKKSKVSA